MNHRILVPFDSANPSAFSNKKKKKKANQKHKKSNQKMPKNLILSRATEADIDALLDPLYAAFEGNDIRTMFFGHDTPASRASAKERIAASMRQGGQNVWLKVVEKETGRVVSGSWWMVS